MYILRLVVHCPKREHNIKTMLRYLQVWLTSLGIQQGSMWTPRLCQRPQCGRSVPASCQCGLWEIWFQIVGLGGENMDKLCSCLAQATPRDSKPSKGVTPFLPHLLTSCLTSVYLSSFYILTKYFKWIQMADCVEPVVPSSRGAHGLFRSSLPSQKPAYFAGSWWG